MASPTNSSYFYRATFIHEADVDLQDGPSLVQARSHSAPADRVGKSRGIDTNTDDERRNYTEKLAEKVDEFVRQHSETSEVFQDSTPTGSTIAPEDLLPSMLFDATSFDQMPHYHPSFDSFNNVQTDCNLATLSRSRGITTFMVRNIPCRITKQQLKASLDSLNLDGTYDFLHLPMTESGTSNLGYFFINFATPELATEKIPMFEGYRFPNTNSPKVCTVRPARLQGFAANIRQFGCDVRGKVQADADYHSAQRKTSSKFTAPHQIKDLASGRSLTSTMPDSCCRQVSDISTIAGYDEASDASESDVGDHPSDGEAMCASPSGLAHKAAAVFSAGLEPELPKGSAMLMKVKRSRPPKFIRERMKRKHRDEALASAAAQQSASQPTSSNTPLSHGALKTNNDATVAFRSAAHLIENCGSHAYDAGHEIYYPMCIPGQQQLQHRPPPR